MPNILGDEITADAAVDAIHVAADDGMVAAAGYARRDSRPTALEWEIEQAEQIVRDAGSIRWDDNDPDGHRVHITTPLGRIYRIKA